MASQATLDRLCAEFDTPSEHILAAVELLEQNATPAFLARYRRYALGNLPEERLSAIAERLQLLNELEQRRASVLEQAEERGRRSEELERALANTADQDLIDDYNREGLDITVDHSLPAERVIRLSNQVGLESWH